MNLPTCLLEISVYGQIHHSIKRSRSLSQSGRFESRTGTTTRNFAHWFTQDQTREKENKRLQIRNSFHTDRRAL
ncbi:MAG: hypothetical protein FJ344_07035 [Sphingomonadales bacterium]|nr:hypothetical protein [Sphingomonadales bacterium]